MAASISATGSYNKNADTIYFYATVSGLSGDNVSRRIVASNSSVSPSTQSISSDGQYGFKIDNPEKGNTYSCTFTLQWKGNAAGDTWQTVTSASASVKVAAPPVVNSISASQKTRGVKSAEVSWTASEASGGTYYVEALGDDGKWYRKASGSASNSGKVTIEFNNFKLSYSVQIYITKDGETSNTRSTTVKIRPAEFNWDSLKTSGAKFNVTKNEWDRLQDRINDTREYRGLNRYNFTRAVVGREMANYHYNECSNAIVTIPDYGTYVYGRKILEDGTISCGWDVEYKTFYSGDPIFAVALNSLRSELNAAMS